MTLDQMMRKRVIASNGYFLFDKINKDCGFL